MAEPLSTVYSAIKNLKEKYGVYYKTCLHLHTPASYDYHLKAGWTESTYRNAAEEQLFQLCVDRSLFLPDAQLSEVKEEFWVGFNNVKEFFSYLLIANELLANQFGMVVVTDHNSIEGVEKLRLAIAHIKKHKAYEIHPAVICGVEITCADKNHVVGILNDDVSVRKKLNDWLEENLYSMKEGVVKLSLEVLEFLRSLGGVGYIAHIDSFESFTKGHFSGAYKKTVLEKESLFGLSNIREKENQLAIICGIKKKEYSFVLDNDAHDIDTICKKPIWIKCEKCSCAAIKEAFANYRTSVLLEKPTRAKKYIEGLYIAHRDHGFLCDKEQPDTPFIMRFSDELNCLIGGRGTGKSTVLAVLEYALAQRCSSERELEFICRHGNIYVLYWDNGKEYLIEMRTAFHPQTDSILRRFGQNPRDQYHWRYKFKPEEIGQYARDHYVDIYLVSHQKSELTFVRQKDKKGLLRQLFDTKYSINELVNTASGDEISDYLYHVLFENRTLTDAEAAITCRSFEGLKRTINDVKNVLKKRESDVKAVVEPFNAAKRGVFEIEYRQDETPQEPPVESWLFGSDDLGAWFICRGVRYNTKNEDVADYLLSLYHKLGFLEFIKLCVNRDSSQAEETVQFLSFCSEMSQYMVDDGIEQLKKDQTLQIVSDILARTITKQNADMVIQYLKHAVKESESFSLKFNINSNESVRNQKADYRDVRDLSLGQKVVAMLSFVLGYSEYMRDFRPLIIDQPEDNLDNQYIYQTLVRQLREEKFKRQVIIATHNASLVTNTNAEQVCVMESNGDNGWVESRGYVGTATIKKHIVNYLEGGVESFKHKCEIYHDVLFKA